MKIDSLPRIHLATLPTPLEEAPRLSDWLGVRVLFKRDDLTGFALGGNKARKLEFLIADALEKKADLVVTGGGPQSNHARMTAAAARKVGMDAALVFTGYPPSESNGNLLLDELLGAEIIYTHTEDSSETDRMIERVTAERRAAGRRTYLIPRGGSTVLGCISYILAVGELVEQLTARGLTADSEIITTGSCGTHAGVLAGHKFFATNAPVIGITVSRTVAEGMPRINKLVQDTAEFLETPMPLSPGEVVIHDGYVGAGYGIITPGAREAIRLVARLEGIFLDPVYTGKTMAGLIDLVQRGEIARGSTVVFWHTGGAPGLFGHAADFRSPVARAHLKSFVNIMIHTKNLDLFAGIPVADYAAALTWYERLLGSPPAFFPNDIEAVWELADHRYVYIVYKPEHAGHAVHLLFVDDLDAVVVQIDARGLDPAKRETLSNGVRKITYRDPDGNEIGFGGTPQ